MHFCGPRWRRCQLRVDLLLLVLWLGCCLACVFFFQHQLFDVSEQSIDGVQKRHSPPLPPPPPPVNALPPYRQEASSVQHRVSRNLEPLMDSHQQQSQPQLQPVDKRVHIVDDQHVPYPHQFHYTINPRQRLCPPSKAIFLLIYVHSAPANWARRHRIRTTWANRFFLRQYFQIHSQLVFPMGIPNDTAVQSAIQRENQLYHDIVQENFIDTYRNLTYKAQMSMKWISTYCSQAKFILKTDDDVLVNIGVVVEYLRTQLDATRTVWCSAWSTMPPERNATAKWYVSEEDFPQPRYPPYCSGMAFILSGDLAPLFYRATLYTKFLWVDDVYLTGVVGASVSVRFVNQRSKYGYLPTLKTIHKFIDFTNSNDTRHASFYLHYTTPAQWRRLWDDVNSYYIRKHLYSETNKRQ